MTFADLEKYFVRFGTIYQKVIGLYRSEDSVYVVQVQKKLNTINEISRKQYDLENNTLPEILNKVSEDFNLKDTLFVTNISTPASLFKIIKIPLMEKSEIKGWLDDNLQDIIKTSIPFHKAVYNYKIIESKEEQLIFFWLFTKEAIENLQQEFKKNDLILYALSPGLADIVETDAEISANYIIKTGNHEFVVKKGSELLYYNQIPAAFHKNEIDREKLEILFKKYLKEDLDNFNLQKQNWIKFDTGNEEDGFKAATALTNRVFTQASDGMNILPEAEQQEFFWKQLFLKATIVLGSILFIIYLLGYGTGLIFSTLQNSISEKAEILAPKTAEVRRLKHTEKILKQDLLEAKQMKAHRSNSQIILDAVAFHITKNCWLTELHYLQGEDNYILGMGKSREAINTFLKSLEQDPNLKQVELKYINHISLNKMFRTWKLKSGKYLEFRINFRF